MGNFEKKKKENKSELEVDGLAARLIATYCKRVMRHRQTNARLSLDPKPSRLFFNDVHVVGFPIISPWIKSKTHTHKSSGEMLKHHPRMDEWLRWDVAIRVMCVALGAQLFVILGGKRKKEKKRID